MNSRRTMKYSTTIKINLLRTKVEELFDNQNNYSSWQKILGNLTNLEGKPDHETMVAFKDFAEQLEIEQG